jgi:hypothetical protein
MRNTKVLSESLKRKRLLGTPTSRWENIKLITEKWGMRARTGFN